MKNKTVVVSRQTNENKKKQHGIHRVLQNTTTLQETIIARKTYYFL